MYAIIIESINSVVFLDELPSGELWESVRNRVRHKIVSNAQLDIPSNIGHFADSILARSIAEPNLFKIFGDSSSLTISGYEPAGYRFGGALTRSYWDRLLREI